MGLKYKSITAKLTLKSGTRIGGGDSELKIGGVEENLRVLRDPISGFPYLPGSSLKGKVRSLLELHYGRRDRENNPANNGEPCQCGRCDICRVFGPHKNTRHTLGPSRLLVRDALLTEDSATQLMALNAERGIDSVELKTENTVSRVTGAADHPRTGERTLRDLTFTLRLSVRLLDGDDEMALIKLIETGFLQFLPNDAIGGSGSRGYGEIEISEWVVVDAGSAAERCVVKGA
ncbi:MAG TPA: type III-A CRISPR-associated RAMP protein Csm3 [Armatimonadota bacterium]|nr:type III-A CRISPR-associated RAMP protein Csm3 [Armatimonadota bacterium]